MLSGAKQLSDEQKLKKKVKRSLFVGVNSGKKVKRSFFFGSKLQKKILFDETLLVLT